jgi:hypothetical protein
MSTGRGLPLLTAWLPIRYVPVVDRQLGRATAGVRGIDGRSHASGNPMGHDTFATTVLVYFEIEERHVRNQRAHIVNSMTVFEFDADAKIRHMTVYLQQPR